MQLDLIKLETVQYLPTKADLADAIQQLKARYENGGASVNPIKDYLVLKRIEAYVKDALDVVNPWAMQQAEQYSDAERKNLYNSSITMKAGTKKYDYSHNPEWVEKSNEVADYEKSVKMAKNDLKALEENMRLAGTAKVVSQSEPSMAVIIL